MKNGKYELVVPPSEYPGKRYRGRYAYEHHVVFWQATGRLIQPGNVLHHKNDSKRENTPENLEEKSRSQHSADHNAKTGVAMVSLVCTYCGCGFDREAHDVKKNQISFFCCRSHQVKQQHADRRRMAA